MEELVIFSRVMPMCVLLFTSFAYGADAGSNKVGTSLPPEYRVIEKWHGTWGVKATRHQPKPAQKITYVEKFDWVVNQRYLRSETSRKSDGSESMSVLWWDILTKTYRFAIYDSNGIAVLLPPPTWHEETQTMEWKSSSLEPLNYSGHVKFSNKDTMQWKALWKDWKGAVILDIEGTSVRRK